MPVYVHTSDAVRARGEEATKPTWCGAKIAPVLRFMAYSIRNGGLRAAHLSEVCEVADGDVLDIPGAPETIALPRHSPGSIAIYVPSAGAFFVGDGLTTKHVLTGRRGPGPAPCSDDPSAAATSFAQLQSRLGAEWSGWVIPGQARRDRRAAERLSGS